MMDRHRRCMLALALLVVIASTSLTLAYAHPTLLPRRHLLAPADKHLPALGDDAAPFASSNIPSDLQSSLDCKPAKTGSTPEPIVCTFHNLVIFKGGFHFLAPGTPADAWALARMQPGGARISR